MRYSIRFVAALMITACTLPLLAHATKQVNFKRRTGALKVASILPKPAGHRPYTESWSMWAKGDKGWTAYATLFIAKMHPFVGTRVGVQLTLISPKGKIVHRLAEFKKKQLYVRPNQLNIRVGKHHITGNLKRGKMTIDLKDVGCWLTYTRVLPGFRLFGGDLKVGRRRFTGVPFAPRVVIKGQLRWKEQRFKFQGVGYLDHAWQNAPHKIARSWYNARAFTKDYTVLVTSMVPAQGWSKARVTGLSVAHKGEWLFHRHGRQVNFRQRSSKRDIRAGYAVPQSFMLRASLPKRQQLALKITHKQQVHRLDVLAHIPKMLRFFVQKLISKPYLFRSRALMQLEFTHKKRRHKVSLPGLSEAVFLNP